MSPSHVRSRVSSIIGYDDDDRLRRRDRSFMEGGFGVGAGIGTVAGALAPPGALVFVIIGALAGAAVGRLFAWPVPVDDWDPPPPHRPHVGANSPDDDLASS